jgi:predicted enzyme related to lactoylglutathione lyase
MDSNTGRFVWYELMTTDPKAAIQFYSEVVGWTTQAFGDGGGENPYSMWVGSQGPLGGVMTLPDAAKKMGAPPHWMSNVEVPDVDAAVAKTKKLGGQVHVEPMDIPKVGRVAVIADPQGGSIAVFKPSDTMNSHDSSKSGEFAWSELATTDHVAAFGFYSELFGWERISEFDMGPMGKYLLFGRNGKATGGMMTKTKDMPMPTSWLYYIHVDNIAAAVERAKAKGARLLHGPMPVPTGELIAQLMDPQGAAFALHAAAPAKSA